jgi:NAD(P)-dependent dehydrogenase (short-subunit alcohol dehydrogenase family)
MSVCFRQVPGVQQAHRSLVIGGSGTLGRAVCRALGDKGSRVALTYHTGAAIAEDLVKVIPGARAWPLDLTATAAIDDTVRAAAQALGGLDALVHCAALGVTPGDPVPPNAHQRMKDIHEPGWDALMAVNVKSAFFACRSAAPYLRREGGNIVLVGSVDGVKPVPTPVPYSASKAALVGMAQAMAKELGKDNVRVNVVAPGILQDGLSRTIPAGLREEYLKHCGLKRLGRPDEVANVIAWLALYNTYVTGQTLLLDGGL